MKRFSGIDIMNQISEGKIKSAPVEYIEKTRSKVIDAYEELLDVGARIRPLIVGKSQIGWVRGVPPSERKILSRWVYDFSEELKNLIILATTLTSEEVEDLTSYELRSISNLISQMSKRDFSLFPYLSAYTTTMSSENLWHGKGTLISSFENKIIEMPDGKKIKILAPSDQARIWASLCTYREQAKKRLDENFNAVLIIRPWAGKNADPISAELRTVAKAMETNSMASWESLIRVKPQIDVNDGWAHLPESEEDLKRELKGFIDGDRHEKVMEALSKKLYEESESRKKKLQEVTARRGGPGVTGEVTVVLTDKEVKERQEKIKKGRPVYTPPSHAEREIQQRPEEKIQKYK